MVNDELTGCSGPCEQGRRKCPHPDACFRPEDPAMTTQLAQAIALVAVTVLLLVSCASLFSL